MAAIDLTTLLSNIALISAGEKRVPEPIHDALESIEQWIDDIADASGTTNVLKAARLSPPALPASELPAGMVMWTAQTNTTTPPVGWLFCAGQTVSQTTYAALYAAIGSTYNTGGEAAGYFRLPNMHGRMIAGYDSTWDKFDALGVGTNTVGMSGETAHILTAAELPAHTHTIPIDNLAEAYDGVGTSRNAVMGGGTTQVTSSVGSGTAHINMPPYIVMQGLIKY